MSDQLRLRLRYPLIGPHQVAMQAEFARITSLEFPLYRCRHPVADAHHVPVLPLRIPAGSSLHDS
ncbi:hypothetical protein AWV79_29995 [Cupriavidus sp. UYMMa02A]|nr:hypothetical protein AWV79_29995 [Cupriavidus sp. UYMMa02A]